MPVTLGFSVLATNVFLMFTFDLSISVKALAINLCLFVFWLKIIYISIKMITLNSPLSAPSTKPGSLALRLALSNLLKVTRQIHATNFVIGKIN